MSAQMLLVVVAPLGVTFVVLVVTTIVVLVLIAIGVALHFESVRAERRREDVRSELEPVFARFLATEDSARLAAELRPVFMPMDAAHRPVAAVLVIGLMDQVPWSQRDELRDALEQAGIIELGERGTRRLSPWRRALACELLGKIGAPRGVPALLERLGDRRPEVRMEAVHALGEIGSAAAVPALTEAFLERTVAPTNVVNDALRKIGGEAAPAFERGIASPDPIVRVSSCYGLSGIAATHGGAVHRLSRVLGSDSDAIVRAAAADGLGLAGAGDAPVELLAAAADPDVRVRRAAVKSLGSFDDPASVETLVQCAEDEDREVAIRAAEALLALADQPRAAPEVRTRLDSTSTWAVQYARAVAEVSAA